MLSLLKKWSICKRRQRGIQGAPQPRPTPLIPEYDLRWPLGGWLRLRSSAGARDYEGTRFGGMADYLGPKGLKVICTIDLTDRFGPLMHVSCSYADHDPSWEVIKALREVFFDPDEDVMMVLPRRADYVNVHPHTFHLVRTPTEWGYR